MGAISCAVTVAISLPAVPRVDRVQFETLLSDISARLIVTDVGSLDATVEAALDEVRRFFDADRVGLLAVSADFAVVRVSHAAYGNGASRISGDINLTALFPWSWQRLRRNQPVVIGRLDDLPDEAAVDRRTHADMGTRASLSIPIRVGTSRLHLVAIQSVRAPQTWPDEYIPRLRLLGEVMVSCLARAEAGEAVRASEARLACAAAAAHFGLWELSTPSGAIWVTPETRRIYGVSDDEPTTWARFTELLHADDRPAVIAALDQARADRTPFDHTYRIVRPDGAVRWIHATGHAADGEVLLGASVDVTERVEAAELARAQETRLREALEELQRLREQLEHENVYLRQEVKGRLEPDRLVGRSEAMRRTLALAQQVAATDSTVLLLGETGTGKERFASLIHESSRRRDRSMIRVNCSAIPTALIESELFGREKGAYTGALSRQVGRFELAHGSTIFLDEVGDLPLEVQVKLLRVLEERTIERLGNPRPVPVNVRIIAATHRDLESLVHAGHFREDLYYRLNVFPLTVPPLRDRLDDIPLLVEAFIDECGRSMGRQVDGVAPGSMQALLAYRWPGNVRELRNVVERGMITATGRLLQLDLPAAPAHPETPRADLHEFERAHIRQTLHDCGWRVRGPHGAAARLGLKATTLESRMKKLGVLRPRP